MRSNIHAPADPNLIMFFNVIKKMLESPKPAGAPDQPTMQTNGQHLWAVCTFSIKDIKRVPYILEEIVTRVESLRRGKPHIV